MKVEYSDTERRPTNKKRKKKRSKFKRIIAAILSILIVLGVAVGLMLTVFFNVSSIKVIGSSIYSTEEIIYASGIMNGNNLLRLPSDKIEARIVKALPYIKEAEIIKSFPNTVGIRVEPTEEKILIIGENVNYAADESFKLLRTVETPPEGLIRIKGIKTEKTEEGSKIVFSDKQQRDVLKDIWEICDEKGFNLTYINVENLVDISFAIDDTRLVKLGTYSGLSDKMMHLEATLPRLDPSISVSISLKEYSQSKKEAIVKYEDIADFIK